MKLNPLFNAQGDDTDRSIWFGNTTNLMQLNDVKYNWAVRLYRQMREQFWISERVDVTADVTDYHNLTDRERTVYDGILSYLTFLDSLQTVNIPHLKNYITAPEVNLCLNEQISQETLHSSSYQYLIETIIPTEKRSSIYDLWREDKILKERCEYIAKYYQTFVDNPTDENYFTALVADYLLESIYFYNGFCAYYTLASRSLMAGSADIFKLINR
jgi:ribonucleoside-diphosphate reductase beta chain